MQFPKDLSELLRPALPVMKFVPDEFDVEAADIIRPHQEYDKPDAILAGIPFDSSVMIRPGCRFGPDGVRQSLMFSTTYEYGLDVDLSEGLKIADIGNVDVVHTSVEETHRRVEALYTHLFSTGAFVQTIGGDHRLAYPPVEAAVDADPRQKPGMISLDPPPHLRPSHHREVSSGTPFRRVLNIDGSPVSGQNIVYIGINTWHNSAYYAKYVKEQGITVFTARDIHRRGIYDVMDEATMRRNVPSVNARWGNLVAIVAGDFLLARSAEIAASLGTEVASLLASTLARLCQGQIAEVRSAYQIDRAEADYLTAVADKTAALMSTACRIGALTAGLERGAVEALTRFGECLGIVFQIRDDVLDVVADEAELGKPPGQDLAEGIYTLPVQRALLDLRVGPELRGVLGRPLEREEVEIARGLVARSSGIAASATIARRYAEEAVEAARGLGEGDVPNALVELGLGLLDDLEQSTRALAS